MENHIEQIEKYLRGQMSQEDEDVFKASLTTDTQLRLYAFIMAYMLRNKNQGKSLAHPTLIRTFAHVDETRSSSGEP